MEPSPNTEYRENCSARNFRKLTSLRSRKNSVITNVRQNIFKKFYE
jgi:hypothetical protein